MSKEKNLLAILKKLNNRVKIDFFWCQSTKFDVKTHQFQKWTQNY
jgi:hypothetical protein